MAHDKPKEPGVKRLLALRLGSNALVLREGVERGLQRLNGVVDKARNIARRAIAARSGASYKGLETDAKSIWLWRSFITCVVLPFLVSTAYFGFLASDQFLSETRFAVRGATELIPGSDALAASGLGALAGMNVNQDAYIIADYIESSSMIDDLVREIDLRAIFSNPKADWWARFEPEESPEALLRYWRNAVRVSVDAAAGIVTIAVRTFSPLESVRVAAVIRARCDVIVNQLLVRMRAALIERAEAEVAVARGRLAERRTNLEQFRNARMVIDPRATAQSLGETITQLKRDLIDVEVKLYSAISSLDADGPRIRELQGNRQTLMGQIAGLESKITSENTTLQTTSGALPEYDQLDVNRNLAERRVMLAERLLDNARADANRHHIYLVSIEDPTLPESSLFPSRAGAIMIVLFSALCLWSLGTLVVVGVRDHGK
jgi:capsular polysaccharide transport system permease protein